MSNGGNRRGIPGKRGSRSDRGATAALGSELEDLRVESVLRKRRVVVARLHDLAGLQDEDPLGGWNAGNGM
jgi:hypothetical protein